MVCLQTFLASNGLLRYKPTPMKTTGKHYKFINSKTGYAIFYHTLDAGIKADDVKIELEKIKMQVATTNTIPADTVYWQEIDEDGAGKTVQGT